MAYEIYLKSATSAVILAVSSGGGTPTGFVHYDNAGIWERNLATCATFEVTGTEYWGLPLTSGEMDNPLLIAHLHSQPDKSEEIVIRTFADDMTTIPSTISAVSLAITSEDLASAVSGAIVSGIGAWGDLRWSKIYGIPLDEWDVIVAPYTS